MEKETKNILELIRDEKVEWKKLGEVCDNITTGLNPRKNFKLNEINAKDLTCWYVTTKDYSNNEVIEFIDGKTAKITENARRIINKRSKLEKNDILFSAVGTVGKIAFVEVEPFNFDVNESTFVLKADKKIIIPKYLFHYLKSDFIQSKIKKIIKGSTLLGIRKNELKDLLIPIPPLSIQEKIVEILDKLTKHTTELQSELQLRKKQYEYYREKLLTFDDTIERKKLCDLLDYEQPTKYIVNSTEYNNKYITPVLTAGQTFILGYTNEKDNIYMASKDNPVIIFDDFTSSNHWVDFNFKIKSSAMKILKPKENVNFRYCYYCIKMINIDTTEHKRLWISTFSQIEIPIPPIEIQEYIVNILDKLDTLVNDITCGLPKEIELRQKQYEYYRSKLLDFKKL